MNKYNWKNFNHLQLGKYAEYYVKMKLTLYGLEVYSSEVDDRGIDFIVKTANSKYYDFQVKSVRNYNYIFLQKEKFVLRDNLIACIVLFVDNQEPSLYLIHSNCWLTPNQLLVSRDYEGKKSKPEWGINLSQRNLILLDQFKFDQIAKSL